MQSRYVFVVLAAFCVATALSAQRSWVVDSSKRPGYDFSDLPPAFSKAKSGDTIIVRSGLYTPATTGKGIRLIGSPRILFRRSYSWAQKTALIVRGLPAGQTFVMKGFGVRDDNQTILLLDGNKGRIHLEDLRLDSSASFWERSATRPGLLIRNSNQVTVTGSHFGGRPGLFCERSTVAITNCDFVGAGASQYLEGAYYGYPGIRASKSRLSIARCSSQGGSGLGTYMGIRPASPAAILLDCDTVLSGHSRDFFTAGELSAKETGMHAIGMTGGRLLVDPALMLVPQGFSSAIKGPGTVFRTPLQSLTARGVPPGGILKTDLFAPEGDLQLLLVSKPGPLLRLPAGDLWLDLKALLFLDASIMDKTWHRSQAIPVPRIPGLMGRPIAFQVLGGPSLSKLTLSNAVVVILQ